MADEGSINPALKKLRSVLSQSWILPDDADHLISAILEADLIILTEEQRDELFELKKTETTQAVSQDYLDYQEVELRKFAIEKAYASEARYPREAAKLILNFLKTGEVPS